MDFRKIIAAYSIIVGIMMAAMWTVFALTDQIPELESKPTEIAFHLAAEFTTAIVLIIGGLAIATRKSWAPLVNMTGLGLLLYTVIVSPGYYAESGEMAFVIMFGVLILTTLIMIIISIAKRQELEGTGSEQVSLGHEP